MANKAKNNQAKHTKPNNAKTGSKGKATPQVKHKEHGAVLTIVIILIAFHGIIAAAAYNSMTTAPDVNRPWIAGLMVLHSLANIVAAAGIYSWKKWGLYLYAASTVVAIVAGLLSVGMWSVFYMLLPAVIVGWLLRTKWDYFD
jgi:hypothetical protein